MPLEVCTALTSDSPESWRSSEPACERFSIRSICAVSIWLRNWLMLALVSASLPGRASALALR